MTRKILTKKTADVTPSVGQRWTPRTSRSRDLRQVVGVKDQRVTLKNLVTAKTTTVSFRTLYKEYALVGQRSEHPLADVTAKQPKQGAAAGSMPW